MTELGIHQKEDHNYISLALELAKKAKPSPNPKVGCVIVKNGKIIGQGYHKRRAEDHAEIVAIKSVKNKIKLKGSTFYVTLEPCSHNDKLTPPCTEALSNFGIKRLVVGALDKNPKVDGIKILKRKMQVTVLNDKNCERLNESFFHYIKSKRPFVLLKMAITLDGKIAQQSGPRMLISNEKSRTLANSWREDCDAILVGVNTTIKDNPKLTCLSNQEKNPIRIILDSKLRIPINSNVFKQIGTTIIATTINIDQKKKLLIEKMGAQVLILPSDKNGFIDLSALLTILGKKEIASLMVEGGAEVASNFVSQKLVNKVALFIAPKILGNGINCLNLKNGSGNILELKNVQITRIEDDILVEGYL